MTSLTRREKDKRQLRACVYHAFGCDSEIKMKEFKIFSVYRDLYGEDEALDAFNPSKIKIKCSKLFFNVFYSDIESVNKIITKQEFMNYIKSKKMFLRTFPIANYPTPSVKK